MPFSKLKNIMILILLVINLLLLCLVIPLHHQQQSQQALASEKLEALFEQYDVTLDSAILPAEKQLYTIEFSPEGDAALSAMRALLGENVLVQDDSTRYLSTYRSDQGQCQLSRSGNLSARLINRTTKTNLEQDTLAQLEAMDVAAAFVLSPIRSSAGVYTVSAVQSLLEVPVFSSTLVFTYHSGVLTRIEGTVFFDTASMVRIDDTPSISCADALVAFLGSRDQLGWVGGTVTHVTQGYLRTETASAAMVRLTPGWRIATDTGFYWVNGITREVQVLEG